MTEPLNVVRRATQPHAVFVGRLTTTAIGSYLVALLIPGTSDRPTLAPLTALLVLQVSLYRTMRSAVQRVGSVTGGVLVAVVLAWALGFTWWSLALAIGAALALGHLLRLGDHVLEVPISAMLILSLPTGVNATDRVLETLVGAAVGMVAGLVLSPLRVQPAEEAIEELGHEMGTLLDEMAGGPRGDLTHEEAVGRLNHARTLGRELGRVDRALGEAEDSIRLNPRAASLPHAPVALRTSLETLEHAWVTIRGLARSVAGDTIPAENDLREHLAHAESHRDRLAETLHRLSADDPAAWPLRGELLVHLDRLLDQLRVEHRASARERRPDRLPRGLPRAKQRRGARRRTATTKHRTKPPITCL